VIVGGDATAIITALIAGPKRSRDPEYPWYTDSDSDGVVCE